MRLKYDTKLQRVWRPSGTPGVGKMYRLDALTPDEVPAMLALWATEGSLRRSSADNEDDLRRYIEHNPGLSVGAWVENDLVAAVIAGHDGRRGYPKHIFVHPAHRRSGIGLEVMRQCIRNLSKQGISVSHYSVDRSNDRAMGFFDLCFAAPEFEVKEITDSRRFELRHRADATCSALLPWQARTRDSNVKLAFRLPFIEVPPSARNELSVLTRSRSLVQQAGPYHRGSWTIMSLIAPDGDPTRQSVRPDDQYKPTENMDSMGALHKFLYGMSGQLRRVRISRLSAGGTINWHYDDFETKTKESVYRLHIPIITAPENFQILSHEIHFWDNGEVWLGDYRFPHMVVNASQIDRFHLIVDIVPDVELRKLVDDHTGFEWFGSERTAFAHVTQTTLQRWRSASVKTDQQ